MKTDQMTTTLRSMVEDLVIEAVSSQGVPAALAERAGRVTARNLAQLEPGALDQADVRRVRSYFMAVVRRESVRADTPEVRRYRHRLIAASVAADLRAVGMDEERVREEVGATLAGACGWR